MAGSVNKVILVGRLGRDPEMRFTQNGRAVTNFTIATNENWTDQAGEKQERTEWHKIVTWGKLAENCAKLLSKGRLVYIEGRLQTRAWDDREGNKRYTTEIVATNMQILSPMEAGVQSLGTFDDTAKVDQEPSGPDQSPDEYDDIPF